MRIIRTLLLILSPFFFLVSCNKEYSMELGLARGSLKQDGTGVCLPATVSGTYKVDSLLKPLNYIDIQLNITETGIYNIKTDTVNGFSFKGAGTADVTGLNTVRLMGSGKPIAPGVSTFTISFDSTECMIDVTVISVGPPATYTLGGTGSNCTGVTANGTYTITLPMSPLNTVMLDVNVTNPGSYDLTTPVVNGISFSAAGDFTATGPQTVTLNAIGTPVAAGNFNYALSGNSGTCTFPITVTGAPSVAVFTLGGAGSTCTGFIAAGTYASGTALSAANTVTLDVNVTTIGTYSISTTAANGVTFTKLGTFTNAGPQTVTLNGSGIPTASGAITHTVNAGTSTCTFVITYTGGTPQAVYTITGSPTNCAVPTFAGTYTAGTALTTSNTVTLQVTVTTAGPYTLTTNTAGGMTFSGSGNLALGPQTIVLTGTGIPVAGSHTFTPPIGTSTCTFNITVAASGGLVYKCKINGSATFTNFIADAFATYYTPQTDLGMEGLASTSSQESIWLNVDKETAGPGTPVVAGTYNNTSAAPNVYIMFIEYVDNAGNTYLPNDVFSGGTADPFTVTITSLTATRVVGTFSGTMRDANTGTLIKLFSEGSFDLPIQ